MFDITRFALMLVFTVPFLMVILTLGSKRVSPRVTCLAGIGVVMVGLVLLGVGGEADLSTPFSFMAEPVTLSISNTAILLYLASLLVLAGLVWRNQEADQAGMTTYQWVLLNLSLSFGFIAFISGQFMIRYIALDIVGLLAALTVLSTFSATSGLRHFIIIFQILRLGDLSLLASILLINHLTGTLDIAEMIAAAVDLPANVRMWVFLGFFLAVLIKLAIWPFGIWLDRARKSAPRTSFWVSGLLVPALGYYLLYRIVPIINAAAIKQNLTLYSAFVLALLVILFTALEQIKFDRLTQVGGVMSCFLLAAIAVGSGQFLLFYLLGLILHRGLMLFADELSSPVLRWVRLSFPPLLNGIFLAANLRDFPVAFSISWVIFSLLLVGWDLGMQRKPVADVVLPSEKAGRLGDEPFGGFLVSVARWLNEKLEFGVFTHGLVRLSAFFHRIADWMYHNIEGGMEKLWVWIGRKLVALSEGTLRKVEVEAAQTTGSLLDDALNSLAIYEKNVLRKALRWDLAWIPFLLVVILIMLFVL
ncbi:MAG: hypothetical protein K0B06_03345 [Brevefilum sp.]|nr:hypothetical protein [Brevefilum sp.]